jgi:hypothetical protein
LGKTVLLVLEEENALIMDKYLAFLKEAANIAFTNIDDGIKYLKTFEK